jgi:hypothetical protein
MTVKGVTMPAAARIRVFSTCPPSLTASPEGYLEQVEEFASWSEDALAGYRTFVLDVPAAAEELRHIGAAFGAAGDSLAA